MAAETPEAPARPADFCRALIDTLDAAEGRRRRRKRDTTADAIGLGLKRELMEAAVQDDPDPAEFEGWLLRRSLAVGRGSGATRAMALSIWEEWRAAHALDGFQGWLERGAPSDDRQEDSGNHAPDCPRVPGDPDAARGRDGGGVRG